MNLFDLLDETKNKSKKDFIINPKLYLDKFLSDKNFLDVFDQAKIYQLLTILKINNIFESVKKANEQKKDIKKYIFFLASMLVKENLSPLTFSFWLSFSLYFNDLTTKPIDWIDPFEFDFPNKISELNFKDFGYGSNIDHLDEFEIEENTLLRIKSSKRILYIPKNIKVISPNAFEGSNFEVVFIPSSVSEIGSHAFKDCSLLETVIFEGEGTKIFDESFLNCESLSYISSLEKLEFKGRDSLKNTKINSFVEDTFSSVRLKSILSQIDSIQKITISNLSILDSVSLNINELIIDENIDFIPEKTFENINVNKLYFKSKVIDFDKNAFFKSLVNEIHTNDSRYKISNSIFFHMDTDLFLVLNNQKNILSIPNFITKIHSGSVNNLIQLKELIVDSKIEMIEKDSINECVNLEKIFFKGNDISVFNNNFMSHDQIKQVEFTEQIEAIIPEVFASSKEIVLGKKFNVIFPFQFANFKYLEKINLEHITIVEDYAFNSCEKLESVDLMNIEDIGFGAFSNCSSLNIMNIKIYKSNEENIRPKVFGSIFDIEKSKNNIEINQKTKSGFRSYFIPNSLKTISISGNFIPYGYFSGITSAEIILEDKIKKLEPYSFHNTSLKEIILEDNSTLGSYSLSKNDQLTIIDNLSNASKVEKYVFFECTKLRVLNLGIENFDITKKELDSLKSLEKIEVISFKNKDWVNDDNIIFDQKNNEIIFVPLLNEKKTLSLSRISTITKDLLSKFKGLQKIEIENALKIEDEAFYNLNHLKELYISNSVKNMGEKILEGCTILEKLTIPFVGNENNFNFDGEISDYFSSKKLESLKYLTIQSGHIEHLSFDSLKNLIFFSYSGPDKSLNDNAFRELKYLEKAEFKTGLENIGKHCFFNCASLDFDFSLHPLNSIEEYAFTNCLSLQNLEFGSELKFIGNHAFFYCINVKKITNVNQCSYGLNSFDTQSELEYVKIKLKNEEFRDIFGKNNKVDYLYLICERIKNTHFSSNKFLKKLIIESSFENVPDNSFLNCSNLEEIYFKSDTFLIGANAFENCKNLVKIHFRNKVKKIGSSAFSNCSSLKEITNIENVIEIGQSSFKNCSSIEKISFKNIPIIRESTFENCSSIKFFEIPSSCKIIESQSFKGCSNMKRISIPLSVNFIDKFAFINSKSDLILFLSKKKQSKTYHPHWNYKTKEIESKNSLFDSIRLKLTGRYSTFYG